MHNLLIHLLTPISILSKVVVFVIGLAICSIETEHNIILIVQALSWFWNISRMLRVLLFEFRFVGVLGHVGLITSDREVTSSVSDGVGNS